MDSLNIKNHQEVIGVLGGGQLGMLLGRTIKKAGHKLVVYAQSFDEPACTIADQVLIGSKNNLTKLNDFFSFCDLVILESEFYQYKTLKSLEEQTGTSVFPELSSYKHLWRKDNQKRFFDSLGIPFAKYHLVKNKADLKTINKIDYKVAMLKTAFGGYDGYGNLKIELGNDDYTKSQIEKVSKGFKTPVLVEQMLKIKTEFSCMMVKGKDKTVFYPPCETVQTNSICHFVNYPGALSENIVKQVNNIMEKLDHGLPGIGIFAFEFFELECGKVVINEAAPRVHNSYHFTIEGFNYSQFELCYLASLGLKLPELKEKHSYISMVNLLGKTNGENYSLSFPHVDGDFNYKIHLYNKKESRPGRKMGHLTLFGSNEIFSYAKIIQREYQL